MYENAYGAVVFSVFLWLCTVFPSSYSSHFLGGSIMVRPKPGGAQSEEMEITSQISWRRSFSGNTNYYCDSNTVIRSIPIENRRLNCQYGCQGSINLTFLCTEYSVEGDWSYLQAHTTLYFVNFYDINTVTIGTAGGQWIDPYDDWNISTTFSLATRPDTGQVNSSPRVTSFPYLYLLEGYYYTIPLAVTDPDNDEVRCRWANGIECSSVCDRIPGAVLDPESCTIRYRANFGTGLKVAAIMIEDFLPCSSVPLSSVAHQFIVKVVDRFQPLCSSPPWFTTSVRGSCINIPPNTTFTSRLRAYSGCFSSPITSIQIIAPVGMSKGGLYRESTRVYYTNIAWTPTANQQNDTHFLCYMAVSSENLTSEQSCIKLAAGYHPPAPLRESATPNHQLVYPSNNTLQIMFDRKIQRPSTSAFIRFYKSGEVVYQIDTSSSPEVNFDGSNLIIVPNHIFSEGNIYYVNFDRGVVVSVEGCHLGNNLILSDTFWTFEILHLMPDVIAVNNQTVGQPLILQCSVTTIRDINSRVDFVWISNGTELERVEGASGKLTENNSAVYTCHYVVPHLSIADNNNLYTCAVIINRTQLTSLSAMGNFTLNIIGAEAVNSVHDNSTLQPCSALPQFVEQTLPPGVCVAVPPGTLFIKQITATSDSCSNIEIIISIKVFGPYGISVGELQHVQGTNNYYINFAWMPKIDQQNKTHLLCFVAVNAAWLNSEPFCMELAAGYLPPAPIPKSANHQLVYPSNTTLSIMFDRTIQRPSTSAFIRFYKLGEEVYQIDVSLSTEVAFTELSLRITPNYNFTEGITYYINFDRGVVQSNDSVAECQLVNEPILSKTFWTFEVRDLTPSIKVMETICDHDDRFNSFIIFFAVSAGINLLLVAVITLTCLVLKQKKNKPVLTSYRAERQQMHKNDPVYEIPTLERQAATKEESSHYVNLPQRQKEAKMPITPKRRVKQNDGASDIKLEENPSYSTGNYSNL